MDTSMFFPSTAPSWYTDLLGIWRWGSLKGVLALKRAVKFRTFLCSLHRIRGFRPPKCMETSWKWNKCSNRRCSAGNPLDAFHDNTHTRGIMWKIIESRSHGWRCCFHKQMLSNFVSSKRPFPRCKRLSLPKRLTHRCPPATAACDLPHPSGPSFNDWQWNVSRHNLTPIEPVFDDDAKHEPWPET